MLAVTPIRAALVASLALAACEASPDHDLPITKEEARDRGGKADDGTDLCAEQRWYGDGVCDDFCPKPDFDCGLPACDPFGDRQPAPELLVGPDGWATDLVDAIAGAASSVDLMVQQVDRTDAIDALVAAAGRGVAARVLLDGGEAVNAAAREALLAAGVEVRASPAGYRDAHAKILVVDRASLFILSGDLDGPSAVEGNLGVVDRDPDDVIDAQAVFDADWLADGGPVVQPDLSCTRLVVTPFNARERLAGFFARAEERLDLAASAIGDRDLLDALAARAGAGVPVRVLLPTPSLVPVNAVTAGELAASGVAVRFISEVPARLIAADEFAFIGSQKMIESSLDQNREVGLFAGGEAAAEARDRFEADWAAGVPPP